MFILVYLSRVGLFRLVPLKLSRTGHFVGDCVMGRVVLNSFLADEASASPKPTCKDDCCEKHCCETAHNKSKVVHIFPFVKSEVEIISPGFAVTF